MRRPIRTLLLTTALTVPFAATAWAQDEAETGMAETEAVRAAPPIAAEIDAPSFVTWIEGAVRADAAGSAERIATLSFGERVTVTGEVAGSDWVRVELADGTVGYMWGELLSPIAFAHPSGGGGGTGPMPGGDGDTLDTAIQIGALGANGYWTSGTLSPTDREDYYTFTVDDWTEVTVDLWGMSIDVDIFLTDDTGYQYGSGLNAGASPEHFVSTIGPGTYYLQVSNYDGGDTGYELSIAAAPGDAPPPDGGSNIMEDPTPLGQVEAGGAPLTVTDWVGPSDYEDYFSFEITGDQRVTVRIDGMSDDADLSLYSSEGYYLASSYNYGVEPDEIVATLQAGTYTIGVNSAGGPTNYTLTVSGVEAPPLPPDTAGNFPEDAAPLGDPTQGALTVDGWVGLMDSDDYYSFTLERAAEVAITMRPAEGDADIDLLSGDGMTYLASSSSAGTSEDRIVQSLEPGDYLVRVYIYSGETPYALEIGAK